MPLSLNISKIVVQKDDLAEIDPENFEVKRLKRGLVDAVAYEDGTTSEVKLVVDTRARLLTVSSKGPGPTAGKVGLGIMSEFKLHSGLDVLKLFENPKEMKDIGRFPIGPDAELFLGFLHNLKERGNVELRGYLAEQVTIPGQPTRVPTPEREARLVIAALETGDPYATVEALRELRALARLYTILENDEIALVVGTLIEKGRDQWIEVALDMLQSLALVATASEKKVMEQWVGRIQRFAMDSPPPGAIKAFYVLLLMGHTAAVDVLHYWVARIDDSRYTALQPVNYLRGTIPAGLMGPIRRRMFDIFMKGADESTRSRASEVLETIRWVSPRE